MAKRILFVHYGDNWIRGSEKCLLDLIHYLDNRQYQPYVWTNNPALLNELDKSYVPGEASDFALLLGWKAPKYDVTEWFRLFKKACAIIERKVYAALSYKSNRNWTLPSLGYGLTTNAVFAESPDSSITAHASSALIPKLLSSSFVTFIILNPIALQP